jgi:hypothetical protein
VLFRWLTLFLDFPGHSFDGGVAFWREVTSSELSPFRGEAGEFATLLPPDADAYLRVQRTADGSGGCHLDLHVDLWAALTGWDLRAGSRPEFASLDRPAGIPIRLLLQRRDHADPLDQVAGHVDFACADPTGRLYCLTGRNPQTGRLPDPAA